MPVVTVSCPVPYVCQYASPDLVRAFVYGERPLESDPGWQAYGAASAEEYAHWARRACGVVCVKMAVDALTRRPSGSVMDWVRAGLALDGYLVALHPDRRDQPIEKGWKHSALADLARTHGLDAELVSGLSISDLPELIRRDYLLIASVSSELGEADHPITRSSGHLVVVLGVELDERGAASAVIVHNPSGRTLAMQAHASIDAERFAQAFSGRGVLVSGPETRSTGTAPQR